MSTNYRIKDIAKKAGVSAGTVDRVLHNRGKVSDAALAKVKAVLSEIDYKPNLIARTLGSNKSIYIAAIVPTEADDPYWSQSISGIYHAQNEWRQYGVTIKTFSFDKRNGSSFIKHTLDALNDSPNGILIAPIFLHEARSFFKYWRDHNVPYVLFNTNLKEAQSLSFIGQNLYESGRLAGELMLIGQPLAKRLFLLHIGEDIANSPHLIEKERGFMDFCKQINPSIDVVARNIKFTSTFSMDDMIKEIATDKDVSGIFVTTSKETALIASLLEHQARPDIRLIGYDLLDQNIGFIRNGTIRFLINQNPKRQAAMGISHLANYLLFNKTPPALELFPLEIISQQNLESYLTSGIH
jgi:LacI family transcriptional regulator